MKAFALPAPDQPAAVIDVDKPQLPPDGVLVRVRAASVNAFDVFVANGYLAGMMEHDYPVVVGRDFAGTVEQVGAERSDVSPGDAVIGFVPATPPLHDGTHAEFVVSRAGQPLAPKPDSIPFDVASALPLAGATALAAVDAVDPQPGQSVLIVGATGGVGTIALQLVRNRGAIVVATAKPGDHETYVRELGANETVDHSDGDVTAAVRKTYRNGVDAVIDLVNRGETFGPSADLVRDGGAISSTLGAADVEGLASKRNVRATNVVGAPTSETLAQLVVLVEHGLLQIPISARYPLAEAADAFAAFQSGKRGKIVLEVAE